MTVSPTARRDSLCQLACRLGCDPAGTAAAGSRALLAVDETAIILLHPPLHLVGVSIGMERERASRMTELSSMARLSARYQLEGHKMSADGCRALIDRAGLGDDVYAHTHPLRFKGAAR